MNQLKVEKIYNKYFVYILVIIFNFLDFEPFSLDLTHSSQYEFLEPEIRHALVLNLPKAQVSSHFY